MTDYLFSSSSLEKHLHDQDKIKKIMSDENKSTQEDELAALKSIYEENDLLALTKSNTGGSFYVKCVAPSKETPFRVKLANGKPKPCQHFYQASLST